MSCFPCFSSEKSDSIKINELPVIQAAAKPALPSSSPAGIHLYNFFSFFGQFRLICVTNEYVRIGLVVIIHNVLIVHM